jgi:hypothetical protein
MPRDPTPATVYLRRLFAEIATLMQAEYTFQGIADLFYEVGVIEKPEKPYPDYEGNKRDYVLEKLHEADDLGSFLSYTVPRVILDCDLEGRNVDGATWVMMMLGYEKTEEGKKHGVEDWEAPAGSSLPRSAGGGSKSKRRIDLPDLPGPVQTLVDELEDNLDRENLNAGALLTRKLIQEAVFIAMHRRKKADALRDQSGDEVDLSVALGRCQQEYGLSGQVMGRITSAKWIGDSANHSYRVKVTDSDLDRSITGIRLFLQEVL